MAAKITVKEFFEKNLRRYKKFGPDTIKKTADEWQEHWARVFRMRKK